MSKDTDHPRETLVDSDIDVKPVTRRSALLETGLALALSGFILSAETNAAEAARRRRSDPDADESDDDPNDPEEDSGKGADTSDQD